MRHHEKRPPDIRRTGSRPGAIRRRAAGALSAAALASAADCRQVHAAGSDVLRIGLIGCGGRGTGAASQALKADSAVKLVAMGDLFADRLESSLSNLQAEADIAAKLDVPPERQFVGWDAYKKVIGSDVDVVLLASPPHFRPMHLEAAVAANKHVFAEKPVAVDAPGIRRVLAACEQAKQRGRSVVSGLCLRYSIGFRETIQKIHDGAIGQVLYLEANDLRGPIWTKPRQPDWTDMHWQMRNWYYFTWLSGDFNVEQHVHFLDVCAWVMQEKYPALATGTGGRQVRSEPEFGNIYDHHAVMYEYADGTRLASCCRQQAGCSGDMSVRMIGSAGRPTSPSRSSRSRDRRIAPSAASTTTSIRPSTTICLPASAPAIPSIRAATCRSARCWRSRAEWPPTPAKRSPGSRPLTRKRNSSPRLMPGEPRRK